MRNVWTIARSHRARLSVFAVVCLSVLVPAFAQQQGPIQVNSQGVTISFQNTGGDATVSRGVGLSFQNTGGDATVSRGISILFNNQGGNAVGSNGTTISFQNAQDARSGSGVTIGFTNSCILSCTATAPTTGAVGASIAFASTAGSTAPVTVCGGSVTYDWNFGDRTPHSTQPNPTHTYNSAGIYSWTLTTNVSGASACVRTGRITIGSPSEYCLVTTVPTGGGTISVSPSGTCYAPGTLVTLTASPSTGYSFNNWSGSSSSVSNQITIAMNGNKNIAASFTQSSQVVLRGIIGIWDGDRPYKLKGQFVSLQVYATHVGNSTPIPADVADSEYSFTTHPLSSGTYDLHVNLSYRDSIYNNSGLVSGCASLNPIRKSTLTITNVIMPRAAPLHIDFKPPLILTHGINSCFKKWHNTADDDPISQGYTGDDPTYWESYARTRGFITFTPNYDTGLSTSNTWEDMASRVTDQIRSNIIALTGDNSGQYPPWIYIAHSMGGLVGRVLTHKWDSTNRPLIRSLKRMYEMGTPNSGSFAGAGLHFLSEYKIQSEFNPVYPDFGLLSKSNVKAFAGNNGLAAGSASDGLVNVYSVFDIYIRGSRFFGSFGVGQYLKLSLAGETLGYRHTEMGDHFSSSNDSRNVIFKDRILQEICQLPGQGGSPCAGLNAPIANTNTSQPTLPTSNLRNITAQTRSLGANQTCALPFNVGLTDSMVVNDLISSGSATLSLTDPFGHVIDFSTLPLTAGERGSNEFGDFLSLHNPAAGLWTLRVVAGSGGATFSLGVAENSPVGLDGSISSQPVVIGQAAHLIGQWLGDASNVTSPAMTAQITDESGAVAGNVTLYDDGAHSDDAAGDGVFGGDTPALANPEHYTATFMAVGVYNGQPFTRWAESSVDVISSSHLFTGDFTDGVYDSDDDGNFDSLQETVVVAVPTIGSYLVLADLEDGQGYFIDHAVGHLQASAVGSYSISLDFKMGGVFCGQYTAPFSIKNLTLSDGASLKTLDIWTGTIVSQTYNGALFGCMAGTPTPTVTNVQPGGMFPGDSKQVIINGKSFQNGAQVSFGAGVSVSSVTFGSASTLIAQVSVSAGATPGPRDVTITNPDGHSSTGTALFNVASDQPPAVSINNVTDGQTVTGVVTVSATATDDIGIQRVEFYLDGALQTSDTTFPYQFVWNTDASSSAPHTLLAKAYDTAKNTTNAQITVNVSCVAAYSPSSLFFPSNGGSGSVNVSSVNVCSWEVTTIDAWISITSAGIGSGNDVVTFVIRENFTASARTGTLSIGGRAVTIVQDGGLGEACQYSISPSFNSFSASGGTGTIQVSAAAGCAWKATASQSWITITSGATGIGDGTVSYSVGANPGASGRKGTITIAGQTFAVKQTGN